MSIIIVDDNTTNQLIVKAILNKANYSDVQVVSSAKELYRLLHIRSDCAAEVHVDLILMDLMMPEIDGIEACKCVQEEERYKDVPIIFVTAVGDSMKLAEAFDAGATDYVMKPINKLELLARIRSALRLKHEKDWHKERDKRIKYELELAKKVQRSVLSHPIMDENIRIEALYQPSFELAGDYYAWFRIDQHRYGIILLDMMGHGISSSLVCMSISSVLKDMITQITDPKQVMTELNQYMQQLYRSDELINYYFTAIFVVIDTQSRLIEYVNAGHPSGLMIMNGEKASLDSNCCAIGLFEDINIISGKITYQEDATILLYTDGLIEASGEPDDVFVEKLFALEASSPSLELQELVSALGSAENSEQQRDDICLVRIRTM